jgi:tetratricopeptide (TPR) repeat protein
VLDILLTGGIIGLVFYGWLYGSFFRQGIRLRRDKKYGAGAEILLVLISSYLVSLFFGFAVVTTEVYFWAALAIMAALSIKSRSDNHCVVELKIRPALRWLLLVGVLALFICQLGQELRVLRADNYYWQMRQSIAQGDYAQALFSYQKIKTQNVYSPGYRYYLVDSLPYDLDKGLNPLISRLYQQELPRILEEIKTETFDDVYTRAKIYSLLRNKESAEKDYAWLIAFAPEMPKNYLNRGRFYALIGENELALADFNKTLSLLPDPTNPPAALSTMESVVWNYRSIIYRNLADVYFAQGDYARAGDNYLQAYRHNLFDAASYKKIADCYFMQGDLDKAIWYNLRGGERHPQDYIWPLGAAILYQEKGQDDLALKYLNQALFLDGKKQIPTALVEKIKTPKK